MSKSKKRKKSKYSKQYPQSVRESILKQILKDGREVSVVASENGIPYNTAWNWVNAAESKGDVGGTTSSAETAKRPEDFTPAERLALLLEASKVTDDELGVFLRQHGLFSSTLDEWRTAALGGLCDRPLPRNRAEEKRIQELERELARKDRALAEVGALLVLRKKAQALWEDEEHDVPQSAELKSSR